MGRKRRYGKLEVIGETGKYFGSSTSTEGGIQKSKGSSYMWIRLSVWIMVV